MALYVLHSLLELGTSLGESPALQTSAFTRYWPISAELGGALGGQLVKGSSSLRVCKPTVVHVKTVPKLDYTVLCSPTFFLLY